MAAAASAATSRAIAQAAGALLATSSSSDKHAFAGGGDSLGNAAGDTAAGGAAVQLSANAAGSSDAVSTVSLKVAAGVESPEFGQGLAERVSYMVDNNLSGAKLQVNPPQLGPIEVRIALQGDHAQISFTSHSAVTREALQASSPKLREMLGAQGFGQVSIDVSQRSFQERSTHAQPYDWIPSAAGDPVTAAQSAASLPSRISSGSVDAYA